MSQTGIPSEWLDRHPELREEWEDLEEGGEGEKDEATLEGCQEPP